MIAAFEGEHAWLSNFYPSPVEWEGLLYPTVENAFQAAKAVRAADRVPFTAVGPAESKQLGSAVPLRRDWEAVKGEVMLALLRAKFDIPALARRLRATGRAELVNGNVFGDRFWGVCRGEGRNELGRLLMRVRGELG